MRHVHWALVATLASECAPLRAQDLFTERVRPLLEQRCAACHNPETKMSGLDVTSREALMRGGKQGVDLLAGKPAESRLFQFVASRKMPPAGALPGAEVDVLRQWIEGGAAWSGPESFHQKKARAGLDWWALQPP